MVDTFKEFEQLVELCTALHGKKLRGVWVLDRKNDNWLVERSQAAPAVKGEKHAHSQL